MCLIIVAPPHRTPNFDNVLQCTWENDDGSGWVIRAPHGLEVVKSAKSIDHVISTFFEARKKWPESWAVWHSRLATHGQIDDANTHPFLVPETRWALVHNGILPLSDGPFGGDRSDSRILAEDCLKGRNWTTLRHNQDAIEKWLAGDKVVVITADKEKGGPVIIFNEHLDKWDPVDDCWYSHGLYYPQYTYKGSYGATEKDEWWLDDVPAITAGNVIDAHADEQWWEEQNMHPEDRRAITKMYPNIFEQYEGMLEDGTCEQCGLDYMFDCECEYEDVVSSQESF